MEKLKISIFENEFNSVKGAFDASKVLSFDSKLDYKVYPSSQLANFDDINKEDVIFIDIDLSQNSELDGFSLISKLKEIDIKILNKIVILTGNNKIIESLNNKGINFHKKQIIIKPTDYEIITESINYIIGLKKTKN